MPWVNEGLEEAPSVVQLSTEKLTLRGGRAQSRDDIVSLVSHSLLRHACKCLLGVLPHGAEGQNAVYATLDLVLWLLKEECECPSVDRRPSLYLFHFSQHSLNSISLSVNTYVPSNINPSHRQQRVETCTNLAFHGAPCELNIGMDFHTNHGQCHGDQTKQYKMPTKAQTDELQDFRDAIDALEAGMLYVVYFSQIN